MVHAFVMVKSAAGESQLILDEIVDFEGVSDAHVVAGDFDLIVEVDTEEVYDVLNTVSARFRSLEEVEVTKTYISLS